MAEPPTRDRPLPLFAWFEVRRAERLRVRARRLLLGRRAALIGAGIACLSLTIALPPLPRLVWNASASAPIGLYAVSPGATLRRGDMVVAWPPAEARQLASSRHYLPRNVPLVKRVAGIAGGGRQTFIEFPVALGVGEAPPIFLLDSRGEAQLVNYRVKGRFYVVDRIFDVAELRLGTKNQQIVRISRVADGARGRRGS